MVEKACFKMALKTEPQKWKFLGKWVRLISKRMK
jgi:hypothetical protein